MALDWLMVLPVRPVAAIWQKGIPKVLCLYQQAKEKAAAHGVLYKNDDKLSKRM